MFLAQPFSAPLHKCKPIASGLIQDIAVTVLEAAGTLEADAFIPPLGGEQEMASLYQARGTCGESRA